MGAYFEKSRFYPVGYHTKSSTLKNMKKTWFFRSSQLSWRNRPKAHQSTQLIGGVDWRSLSRFHPLNWSLRKNHTFSYFSKWTISCGTQQDKIVIFQNRPPCQKINYFLKIFVHGRFDVFFGVQYGISNGPVGRVFPQSFSPEGPK